MRLREWAHSNSGDGAQSASNYQFLDALLRRGSLAAAPEVTISVQQTMEQGIPCIRLRFHLPQACRSAGVESIAVLVPTVCVGTGYFQPNQIFYSLIEEIIGWLAGVGPKNTLIRLYNNNNGQPLARSYSSSWQQLHSGFTIFINGLRQSQNQFPGLGQINGGFGVIEVAQARTSANHVSGDYVVTLTLSNRQCMSLFLPRTVAQLPSDWLLDWLTIQNEFSSRV
jgi:hypothetical protein